MLHPWEATHTGRRDYSSAHAEGERSSRGDPKVIRSSDPNSHPRRRSLSLDQLVPGPGYTRGRQVGGYLDRVAIRTGCAWLHAHAHPLPTYTPIFCNLVLEVPYQYIAIYHGTIQYSTIKHKVYVSIWYGTHIYTVLAPHHPQRYIRFGFGPKMAMPRMRGNHMPLTKCPKSCGEILMTHLDTQICSD